MKAFMAELFDFILRVIGILIYYPIIYIALCLIALSFSILGAYRKITPLSTIDRDTSDLSESLDRIIEFLI